MQTYTGLQLKAPKQIEIMEDRLEPPGPQEVLIRVDNIGLCGSDVHLYYGTYAGPKNYPMFFGHEWAGIVEQVGTAVSRFKKGDKVGGDCSIYCGTCAYCQKDKNVCQSIQKFGITTHGASREYILQDQRYVYQLPEMLALNVASLLEPVAVACHAAQRLKNALGDFRDKRILVYGGGTIGLSVVAVLHTVFGCQNVHLFDLIPHRVEIAQKLGAIEPEEPEWVNATHAQNSGKYSDFYHPLGYDVIFETTGVASVFNNALNIVKPLGAIVAIGFIPEITMNLKLVTFKALTIMGSIGGTGEFERLIPIITEHQDYFSYLVSHRFSYHDADKAFATATDRENAIKVQITFS